MKTLQTVRLKPNPPGKDRSQYGGASPAQLGAEWIDIKNVSVQSVGLNGVTLYHVAYSATHPKGRWEAVTSFGSGILKPGQVVRVHAGQARNFAFLRQEDKAGADFHAFTGRDSYVWNNDRGDCAFLWMSRTSAEIDKAHYSSKPWEGVVLRRVGSQLTAATSAYQR